MKTQLAEDSVGITFRLPNDIHQRLKCEAEIERRSMQSQLLIILEKSLAAVLITKVKTEKAAESKAKAAVSEAMEVQA